MASSGARSRFDIGHLLFGMVGIGAGVAAALYGHALIARNEEATNVIVTVFSILSGFLIAIMTLLGDQSMLPGSWRFAIEESARIRAKLIRQKWLFYCYLVTLSLIFVATLLRKPCPDVTALLERAYLGFAVTAFIFSFRLPGTLMQVQSERMKAVAEARRAKASRLDAN